MRARSSLLLPALLCATACGLLGPERTELPPAPPDASDPRVPGRPRHDAVLAGVSGSRDGKPLTVTRANVEGLVRDLAGRSLFRRVSGPERTPGPGDVRLELEEHYTTEPRPGSVSFPWVFGKRVVVTGTMTLRVRFPGTETPVLYEASTRAARIRRRTGAGEGETRELLVAEIQAANLEQIAAQLGAEERLFEPGT